MIRKRIYRWHRTLSLVIAIPVLLWAMSGFMHPVMTTFRPAIATQFLRPQAIDSGEIRLSLRDVLSEHGIARIHNFRIVEIGGNWFYQVQAEPGSIPAYYSTRTGRILNSGDKLYAQYLAHRFLNGEGQRDTARTHETTAFAAHMPEEDTDCCLAAVECVREYNSAAKINGTERITEFNSEYKYVNRLLPVYRISFEREDGIRIYVETTTGRFAYAVNDSRAFFDKIFSLFHTWSWLDALGKFKYFVMVALLGTCMLTTGMGLYIFFITKSKPANGNTIKKARNNHRWTAVTISLFTLFFAFSGAFHAFEKIREAPLPASYSYPSLETNSMDFRFPDIISPVNQSVTDVRLACFGNKYYCRVTTKKKDHPGLPRKQQNDLMKNMAVAMPDIYYLDMSGLSILNDGERMCANSLASYYSGRDLSDTASITLITKFEGEYGFVNKRLPVWKVAYSGNGNERYYVETGTGALAIRVEDRDLYEGYSFALLHKHHFMDWAGKTVRDISTMFWAMAQIVMIGIGLTLWWKIRQRGRRQILSPSDERPRPLQI